MSEARWLPGLKATECVFLSPPDAEWRGAPGRALFGPDGALALNFAPSRWLLLATDDLWLAPAAASGGLLFDGDGKWRILQLPASHCALRASIDVESMLQERDCAAVLMFDTPSVIVRCDPQGVLVCVPASYAASLEAMIQAC